MSEAQRFLFLRDYGESAVMTRYYMGQVLLYANGDSRAALIEAARCLSACPLMAEFWCLAGDALYSAPHPNRPLSIYRRQSTMVRERLIPKPSPWYDRAEELERDGGNNERAFGDRHSDLQSTG